MMAALTSRNEVLQRSPGVMWRAVGEDIFLAGDQPGAIHHLNRIAAGMWRLLEVPQSRAQILDVFRSAFPDVEAAVLDSDINRFLDDLIRKDLVCRERETGS